MLSFFAMGFVDLVGTATNYIKADFGLSDAFANLCTTMVFFWFLIVSIPTGALMNRIGRRKTTLLSLGVTALALLVPVFNYSAVSMILSFCLLGIGNAIMQVSLNPLVANIVSGRAGVPRSLRTGASCSRFSREWRSSRWHASVSRG